MRFYVSYDGGAKWLDQGMRSVNVSDALVPRPLAYDVILQIIHPRQLGVSRVTAQDTGHPLVEFTPPSGRAGLDSGLGQCLGIRYPQINSRVSFSMGIRTTTKAQPRQSTLHASKQETRTGSASAQALPSSDN